MDRGGWRATVHGVTEADVTEQPSMHTCTHVGYLLLRQPALYLFSTPGAGSLGPAGWLRPRVPGTPGCALSAGLLLEGGGADSAVSVAPAGDLGHPHLESQGGQRVQARGPRSGLLMSAFVMVRWPKPVPVPRGSQDRSGCGSRAMARTVLVWRTVQNGAGLLQVLLLCGMVFSRWYAPPHPGG